MAKQVFSTTRTIFFCTLAMASVASTGPLFAERAWRWPCMLQHAVIKGPIFFFEAVSSSAINLGLFHISAAGAERLYALHQRPSGSSSRAGDHA